MTGDVNVNSKINEQAMENNQSASRPKPERRMGAGAAGTFAKSRSKFGARRRKSKTPPPLPDGTIGEEEEEGRICATCGEFIPTIYVTGQSGNTVMRPRWVSYTRFIDCRTTRAYGLERSSRYRQIEVTEDAWTTTRQGFTSADVRLLTASINNARRNRQNMLLRQIAHERLQDIIDSTYEDLSHKMLN